MIGASCLERYKTKRDVNYGGSISETHHLSRRLRHPDFGGSPVQAKADAGNWRNANPVAYHENLFPLRRERIYRMCRLQTACNQGMVCGLFPTYIGCYL